MSRRAVLWATTFVMLASVFGLPVQSQMLSNLLGPLLEAWIRTQVQQVDDLRVAVSGPDSEVAGGRIQSIEISGRNIVYEGIPARSLAMRGSDIRLDTRGSLAGGGLRLEKSVLADLALRLSEQDINTYLASRAFQDQVRDLKITLPAQFGGDGTTQIPLEIRNPRVRLLADRLEVQAVVRLENGEPAALRLASGVAVASPRELRLVEPRIVSENGQSAPLEALVNLPILLGPEVEVRRVSLTPGMLVLEGSYRIEAAPPVAGAADRRPQVR
ncbi:LmeA family phospholipid-binding protein [Gloeobacter violaceus]|uniref:Glr2336 protein n=1 Tax=Gloeobacter violaceus (strain ATCC 29082 / PCC 7421) TaxID=251221 RepID=Q7NI48_GLOVI|nr:DUF2993 domain-containing protein [Gloeobacter violaceus]BAC90277.1 glr2336 [Gloeobacter violaceus PCC 7421]